MATNRGVVRIWPETQRKLKLEAAHQGVSIIHLIDSMVEQATRDREATGKLVPQSKNEPKEK